MARSGNTARAVLIAFGLLLTGAAAPVVQRHFATPQDAAVALAEAAGGTGDRTLAAILGPGSGRLLSSGDPVQDANARAAFVRLYRENSVVEAEGDRATLSVGADPWPFPVPMVRGPDGWRFDSGAGAEELIARRIGRNEIAAVRTILAIADAQAVYADLADAFRQPRQYARRLVSSPGRYDGLYWPQAEGGPPSPLGPLVDEALADGYPGELVSGRRVPYQGYFFRILTAQGPNAPGGARSYMQGGAMPGGFAVLAWPANYGSSGVMSFVADTSGVVFQKNLGPNTPALAAAITRYDPDLSWARVVTE